jgi:hypothetical protein
VKVVIDLVVIVFVVLMVIGIFSLYGTYHYAKKVSLSYQSYVDEVIEQKAA